MIRYCAVVLTLLACTLCTIVHAAIVRGDIVEKETGLPVAGATVEIAGRSFITTSGQDGLFLFRNVPEGGYTIQVSEAVSKVILRQPFLFSEKEG